MGWKTLPVFGLPKTGQTATSPTANFAVGDDGYFQVGEPFTTRFVDNLNGTIRDVVTGLTWVKQPELMIPGAVGIHSTNQIQAARGAYAAGTSYSKGDLVSLDLASVPETITVDGGAYANNVTPITRTAGVSFGSEDIGRYLVIVGDGAGTYRIVGHTDADHVTVYGDAHLASGSTSSVLMYFVSIADSNQGNFPDTGGSAYWRETVWTASAANLTTPSLMQWSGDGDGTITAAEGAIERCLTLEYAGYTDWRLPSIHELVSLYDFGDAAQPCINSTVFPNTQATNYYWSSTTRAVLTTYAWWAAYGNGATSATALKTASWYARPVRGGFKNDNA